MAIPDKAYILTLTKRHSGNPLLQPIKGVFIFNAIDELANKARDLMKTLSCEVTSNHENRFTVRTSRGNMQSIKQRWLAKEDNVLSKELNTCISQIIIGGSIN